VRSPAARTCFDPRVKKRPGKSSSARSRRDPDRKQGGIDYAGVTNILTLHG